jgi:hypothetical protein
VFAGVVDAAAVIGTDIGAEFLHLRMKYKTSRMIPAANKIMLHKYFFIPISS